MGLAMAMSVVQPALEAMEALLEVEVEVLVMAMIMERVEVVAALEEMGGVRFQIPDMLEVVLVDIVVVEVEEPATVILLVVEVEVVLILVLEICIKMMVH